MEVNRFNSELSMYWLSSVSLIFPGLATWGKKVGRKWDQLKRSDSSELLANSAGRRRHWSPNSAATPPTHPPTAPAVPRARRVSRVESLRNLFVRGGISSPGVQNKEKTVNNNVIKRAQGNGPEWVKEECQKGISDLYQLNELLISECNKQTKSSSAKPPKGRKRALTEPVPENPLEEHCLVEYILSHQASAGKETENTLKSLSYDDLLATFKDLSRADQLNILKKSTQSLDEQNMGSYENQKSQLSVLPEESSIASPIPSRTIGKRRIVDLKDSRGSCEELPRRGRKTIVLKQRPDSTPILPGSQMDVLCSLLSNLLVVKADESGYESDSTRAGSDSPRGSIKSSISDVQIPRKVVTRTNSNTSFITEQEELMTETSKREPSLNTYCCKEAVETKCDDAKLISGKLSEENLDDVFHPNDTKAKVNIRDLSPANETDEEKLSFSRKRNAKINIGIRRGDVKSVGLGYRKSTGSQSGDNKSERIVDSKDISLQSLLCNRCKPTPNETGRNSPATHQNLYQRFLNSKAQQAVPPLTTNTSTSHLEDKEFRSMRYVVTHTFKCSFKDVMLYVVPPNMWVPLQSKLFKI